MKYYKQANYRLKSLIVSQGSRGWSRWCLGSSDRKCRLEFSVRQRLLFLAADSVSVFVLSSGRVRLRQPLTCSMTIKLYSA